MSRMSSQALMIAACVAGAVTGACSSTPPSAPPVSEIAAPPAQPSENAAIEGVYREFWSVSWVSSAETDQGWEQRLRAVATAELSEQVATRARQQRTQGVRLYGSVTPRITGTRIEGDRAVVTDCQDGSQAGLADAATGQPRNVGPSRNAVSATLSRESGGWRVAKIEYPGGEC
ncbi:hypothetical protein [Saccharopolyspora sp. NPDC049426]|uniref:hypothetical protein n=1 Tax=Saccharopolyspora sp. NPDC049426 TaxID=3155652 RepID=UPI0034244C6D